jgi:hypothetical protein
MAKGDKVLVRGYRNRPYNRCIWEERREHVLVCSEEDLLVAKEDGRTPVTPGVAKNNCFRYDEELFIQLQAVYRNSAEENSLDELWGKAVPY